MRPLDPISVSLNGQTLIEASAGTGKTYTITTLVVRLIAEADLPISDILVVTFTDAAAAELSLKISDRLRDAYGRLVAGDLDDPLVAAIASESRGEASRRIRGALRELDTAAISTIHSFCRRILTDHAFESGVSFDRELVKETTPLFEGLAQDFFADMCQRESDLFSSYLDERRFSPARLVGLLEMWVRSGEAILLPETVDAIDPTFELCAAFDDGKTELERHHDEIRDLLLSFPGKKKGHYRKNVLEKWLDQVGRYFSHHRAHLPGKTDPLEQFSSSTIADKTEAGISPPAHPFFSACDRILAARDQFDQRLIAIKQSFLRFAEKDAERRKARENIHTFDDLLRHMDSALRGPAGHRLKRTVGQRFKALLIDEFQDTDDRQYRIFNTLFGDGTQPFFMIGDPKQSIYRFRGADIHTYLRAADDAGNRAFTLTRNWRSDPGLIHAVNTIFGAAPNPFMMARIAFRPAVPSPDAKDRFPANHEVAPFEIRLLKRSEESTKPIPKTHLAKQLPEVVARDISVELTRDDILGRPTTPADMAVLVKTNQEARDIQNALTAMGIQSVLFGDTSVYDTIEAEELACVLAAVADPKQTGRIAAALSTRLFGMTSSDIEPLRNGDDALDGWTLRFESWRRLWQERGVLQMMFTLLHDTTIGEAPLTRLARTAEGQRAITNVRHLAELLDARVRDANLSMTALMDWFTRERMGMNPMTAEESQLRLERDDDAVRIITIHKSKGLQFNIVYCPYLWEGTRSGGRVETVVFHEPHPPHALCLDLGGPHFDAHKALARAEADAEEMRLAYVALTRAKHRCIVIWGGLGNMAAAPLATLFHPERQRDSLAKLHDEDIEADLRELAARSGGTIRVGEPPRDVVRRAAGDVRETPLSSRRPAPQARPLAVSTSFSSMLLNEDEQHDPSAIPSIPLVPPDATSSEEVIPLDELEHGARVGNCLHDLFELLDFTDDDRASQDRAVTRALDAYRLDTARWTAPVAQTVRDTLARSLDPDTPNLKLCRIPNQKTWRELEFIFPISSSDNDVGVSANTLAAALPRRDPHIETGYREQVAALSFPALHGFMKGFIDLVFEHGDRYYIVDYKTNYLGPHPHDYDGPALKSAMAAHHYYLQYLIYTLALDRFLSTRIPGYDYDRHFGGVYYLFLRGIRDTDSGGVFAHRPEKTLITALSDCLKNKRCDNGVDDGGQLPLPGFVTPDANLPKKGKRGA